MISSWLNFGNNSEHILNVVSLPISVSVTTRLRVERGHCAVCGCTGTKINLYLHARSCCSRRLNASFDVARWRYALYWQPSIINLHWTLTYCLLLSTFLVSQHYISAINNSEPTERTVISKIISLLAPSFSFFSPFPSLFLFSLLLVIVPFRPQMIV